MLTDLLALIEKLNDTCARALGDAGDLCRAHTHDEVAIEHLLLALSESSNSDWQQILRHFGVDQNRVSTDLGAALERFRSGSGRNPVLSESIQTLVREAWSLASLAYGAPLIRSGHLLFALMTNKELALQAWQSSPELKKLVPQEMERLFVDLTAGSSEATGAPSTVSAQGRPAEMSPHMKTPALDQYTIDLTQRARQGAIDPVLGRDAEIRQVIDILTRRRQNNPILTGEAGVGKTAVVEGLALRIVDGEVPLPLQNVSLRTLDLGLLQAGAGVRGEFEKRLKSVIEETKASPQPVIMFIDEAHTLIGAGGQEGHGDAANLLKPALARGELRTIAATTWAEYKKYFEKDAALARRFQVVKVEEPAEVQAITMMRGLVRMLEQHHRVRILDEAVEASVRLSSRYIAGRQLPDKSVSVLDTACAKVALGQAATPALLEEYRRSINDIKAEIGMLQRENVTGGNAVERLEALNKQKVAQEAHRAELEARWKAESRLVAEIRAIRERLEAGMWQVPQSPTTTATEHGADVDLSALQNELKRLTEELKAVQGEFPLMHVCVDANAIAEVVGAWTGIPVGRMLKSEITTILSLKDQLEKRIIGQSHALEAIAQRISTARARLEDPRRPVGVFLLVGPSGVGKTETAIVLAELLYGGAQNMVVINMSEFKEEHKVSLLMGSPPGYVGYGEGGVLTEGVRRRPYSVLLLDEIEKAHPGVHDVFYQVFDKGVLRDGEGRDIDFRNTVILMTSNVGSETLMEICRDPERRPDPEVLAEALRPDLGRIFKPAFLGRVMTVPYYPVTEEMMRTIIGLQLNKIATRVKENHQADFTSDPELITEIAARCTEVESGARNVDHILTRMMLPELSRAFLERMAKGEGVSRVHVTVGDEGAFRYDIS